MLYLVIERFRDGSPEPVYRRLAETGRGLPEGLAYVDSWVTADFGRCYQVMECADAGLLDEWMAHWSDLVDFEVLPVVRSAEAAAAFAPRP